MTLEEENKFLRGACSSPNTDIDSYLELAKENAELKSYIERLRVRIDELRYEKYSQCEETGLRALIKRIFK